MCITTFSDNNTSTCPFLKGLHKRAIAADIRNLSIASSAPTNFTRSQDTHREGRNALKLPVSLCGNGSLNNRHPLRHHSTMMPTSQILPHEEQHVREHHPCARNNYATCSASVAPQVAFVEHFSGRVACLTRVSHNRVTA